MAKCARAVPIVIAKQATVLVKMVRKAAAKKVYAYVTKK